MYKYLKEVHIPILGMVDDIIGVAEAGFKTQLPNAFINVKTAEKTYNLVQTSARQ